MMRSDSNRAVWHFVRTHRAARSGSSAPRGFSLIEAVVSVALVGVVMVAALSTLARARQSTTAMDDRTRAGLLAQAVLAEILPLAYEDPDVVTLALGPDVGESGTTRAAFDDVDDYNGWSSAPKSKSGVALAGFTGWTVSVAVQYVSATNFQSVALIDPGVKKITVTAARNGVTLQTAVALRTDAAGTSGRLIIFESQ